MVIQTQHDTGLCVDRLTTASGHSSSAYTKSYGNPDLIGMLSEQKRYVDAYVYLKQLKFLLFQVPRKVACWN